MQRQQQYLHTSTRALAAVSTSAFSVRHCSKKQLHRLQRRQRRQRRQQHRRFDDSVIRHALCGSNSATHPALVIAQKCALVIAQQCATLTRSWGLQHLRLAIQQQHFWYSLKDQHLLSVFNFGDNSAASAQLSSASVSVAAAHILQFSSSISST